MTAHTMTNMAEAMRTVTDQQRARQILSILRHRIGDIQMVGWPLLEQSLRDELARAEAVARERGFAI
jgi:hypothetical protein